MKIHRVATCLAIATAGASVSAQGLECDYELDSFHMATTTGYPSDYAAFGDYLYVDIDSGGHLAHVRGIGDTTFRYVDLILRLPPVLAQDHLYFQHKSGALGIIDYAALNLDDRDVVDEVVSYPGGAITPLGSVGRILFAAQGDDLVVLDLHEPLAPTRSSTGISGFGFVDRVHVLSTGTRAIAVGDGLATVLDITDPHSPVARGTMAFAAGLQSRSDEIVFLRDRLYALGDDHGIHVFEIDQSDELVETIVYDLESKIDPESIMHAEGRLWVRSRYGSFAFSANPQNGWLEQVSFMATDFEAILNGVAVHVETDDENMGGIPFTSFRGYPVEGPGRSPLLWDGGELSADAHMSEDLLISLSANNLVEVYELQSDGTPVLTGSIPISAQADRIVAVEGNRAYIAHGFTRLSIVSLDDPANPALLLNAWDIPEVLVRVFHISDSIAYMMNWGKLVVYDMSEPGTPVMLQLIEDDDVTPFGEIMLDQGHLFVSLRNNRVRIYDASDPSDLLWISDIELRASFTEVDALAAQGSALFVGFFSDFYPNFDIYDISDLSNPTFEKSLSDTLNPTDISIRGDTMLVSTRDWYYPEDYYPTYGCYVLYDISDPLDPALIQRSYEFGTNFTRAVLLDDVAMLIGDTPILMRYDQACETCSVDIDQDRAIGIEDINLLVHLYYAGDPFADFNEDGSVNFFDIAEYIAQFQQGCM